MFTLTFHAPPLPFYIACSPLTFSDGQSHPARRSIGVFDLLLVKDGCLYVGEEEQHYTLHAGQALILLPDLYHYATQPCSVETHLFWLHFQTTHAWSAHGYERRSRFDMIPVASREEDMLFSEAINAEPFVVELPQFCTLETPASVYSMLDNLLELGHQPQAVAHWKQQMLFQSLLQELSRAYKPVADPALLVAEQTAAFLRHHYREQISYAALKEALHFHPTYLSRCKRRIFGCTPLEYLLDWRIEQSRHLLMNTNLSVGHIADAVGFHHLSYFIRCFARREGMTPQVFRQQFHTMSPPKTFRSL